MEYIIPGLCLAILIVCGWRGYRNGIVRGLCGIIAVFLAIQGATLVATKYNDEFDGMMQPFVKGMVDSAVDSIYSEDEEELLVPLSKEELQDVYQMSFSIYRQLGISEPAAEIMANETVEENKSVNQGLYNYIANAASVKFTYIAIFFIAFIIIMILFTVIGNIISLSLKIPKSKIVEPILGALLGLLRGIIIIYVVCMAFRYLGLVLPDKLVYGKEITVKLITENPVANYLVL